MTRAKGKPVVVISLEDYDQLDETAYLLSSPANRAALDRAIGESDPKKFVTRTMEQLEAMERE